MAAEVWRLLKESARDDLMAGRTDEGDARPYM